MTVFGDLKRKIIQAGKKIKSKVKSTLQKNDQMNDTIKTTRKEAYTHSFTVSEKNNVDRTLENQTPLYKNVNKIGGPNV